MTKLLALVLALTLPTWGLTLIDQVEKAEVGDYLVTYQNRCYTVLVVKKVEGGKVFFEEISVPRRRGGGPGCPWNQWVQRGAPGYSNWMTYAIDVNSRKVGDSYSFSRRGWVKEGQNDQFLTRLLTLQFQKVPEGKRRKTGRGNQVWNPPLVANGRQVRGVKFEAYEAQWPKDGSVMAGTTVTIYLPEGEGQFPGHFPYWIEINPLPIDQKIRVVDSGRQLVSPRKIPS